MCSWQAWRIRTEIRSGRRAPQGAGRATGARPASPRTCPRLSGPRSGQRGDRPSKPTADGSISGMSSARSAARRRSVIRSLARRSGRTRQSSRSLPGCGSRRRNRDPRPPSPAGRTARGCNLRRGGLLVRCRGPEPVTRTGPVDGAIRSRRDARARDGINDRAGDVPWPP